MTRKLLKAIGLLTIAGSLACEKTPTDPTEDTTAEAVTETISATIYRGGSYAKSFTVTAAGTVTVTLTSLSQDVSIGLGLGFFDPNRGCILTYAVVTTPYLARSLSANAEAGSYCAMVYDIGQVTDATLSFGISVTHY